MSVVERRTAARSLVRRVGEAVYAVSAVRRWHIGIGIGIECYTRSFTC